MTKTRARPASLNAGDTRETEGPRIYGVLAEAAVLPEPQGRDLPVSGSLDDTIRGLFPLSAEPSVASSPAAPGGTGEGPPRVEARVALKVPASSFEEAARGGVRMLAEAAGRASAAFALVVDVRELRIIPPEEMARRFGGTAGWPSDFWEEAGEPRAGEPS